jgi:hypothetical protein
MQIANSATTRVAVALPKILTRVGDAFTDTVFIRSDSMKVAKDPKVYLCFYDDAKQTPVLSAANVDSAGYKYKSRWTANEGVSEAEYFRQFPPAPQTYRMWDTLADSCLVTFRHDSLYAVGGKLTVECKGALRHVDFIDNSFKVVTDSLPFGTTDSIQMKKILIDKDPANALFLDSLQYDIIKAIAWQEYAGYLDPIHCHNPNYNPRYNNYWDDRINGSDTCYDTHTPCENTAGTATGTMQIERTQFYKVFAGLVVVPSGYSRCLWDSLAWNWKINIHNGKYIFSPYNRYYMNGDQKTWDSVCVSCNPSDPVPRFPNREDLSSYGYNQGVTAMAKDLDRNNW